MNIVTIILLIAVVYVVAGFLFAIAFVTRGVTRIDEAAQGSGWGFRVIIFPGTILFWPVLLRKWIAVTKRKDND
jgi:hypothetical protein